MKNPKTWLSTALILVPVTLVGCGGGKTQDIGAEIPAAEEVHSATSNADIVPPAPTGENATLATAVMAPPANGTELAPAAAPEPVAAVVVAAASAPAAAASQVTASTTVTAVVPPVAARAYGAIRNVSKGAGLCLTLTESGRPIQLAACADTDRQKWSFEGTGPYRIRNKWSDANGKAPCLTAPLGMNTCAKKDGGGGYDSQRTWMIHREPARSFSLSNKYTEPLVLRPDDNVNGGLDFKRSEPDALNRWTFDGPLPIENRTPLDRMHVLVVATHYDGIPPADPERVRKAVLGDGKDFASLQHHVFLSSGGKLALTGQMVTDVNLGPVPTACPSFGTILSGAKAAALAKGVNPADFTHTFVDISSLKVCSSWAGLGEAPGTAILSNGVGYKYWMWAHEFGHNLGGAHPRATAKCPVVGGVVQLGSQCTPGDIDDPTDSLGGGGRRLFPADYQLKQGWLTEAEVPWIDKPGTYTFAPLWTKGAVQGYRIARAGGTYLLLEFRQPQAGFEDWPEDSPFVNGVIIRTVSVNAATISHSLVDTTPGSAKKDMTDAPLMPGRSLFDTASGATVTVKSVGPKGAVVEVSFAPLSMQ